MGELKTKTVSQKTRADYLREVLADVRRSLVNNTDRNYIIGLIDGATRADDRLTPSS